MGQSYRFTITWIIFWLSMTSVLAATTGCFRFSGAAKNLGVRELDLTGAGAPPSIQASLPAWAAGNSYALLGNGGTAPYQFNLLNGVGTLDPVTAIYSAPSAFGETATIGITDSTGRTSSVEYRITGPVTAIASGSYHTCAIINGGAWCWGSNETFQLGNDSAAERSGSPLPVTGLDSGVTAISAGDKHTCAIVNGAIKCWGDNQYGQLGTGAIGGSSSAPVAALGIASGAQVISAGQSHTCAVVNGGAMCWGANSVGQIGNGTTAVSQPTPAAVSGLGSGVLNIVTGGSFSCALIGGNIRCWGNNLEGQLGDGTTTNRTTPVQTASISAAQALAAGYAHTCALEDGNFRCWGYGTQGQLGNGPAASSLVPVSPAVPSGGGQFITAGRFATCGVINGATWCWGDILYGTSLDLPAPMNVEGTTAISAGRAHACAIANGSVWCWGDNFYGQLGLGTIGGLNVIYPVQIPLLAAGIQSLTAGSHHACALVAGRIQCWGSNQYGELGIAGITESPHPIPVSFPVTGAQAVSSGDGHTCAIINGAAKCWGRNDFGQLGDGTLQSTHLPVQVAGLESGVQSIAAGAFYTCAIVNGAAKCWGKNAHFTLGDGTSVDSPVPVQATGLASGVQGISVTQDPLFSYTTCAIVAGSAKCWGWNFLWNVGDGTSTERPSPVQVTGLTAGVRSVSVGSQHTCAIVNGTSRCWGSGTYGQCGLGNSTGPFSTSIGVLGLGTGGGSIYAGTWHTCAITNGSLYCWGRNTRGEVGNGLQEIRNLPALILNGGVELSAAGDNFQCAGIKGQIRCWGSNDFGKLGSDAPSSEVSLPRELGAWH